MNTTFILITLALAAASVETNLVPNGGFELGLTPGSAGPPAGWSAPQNPAGRIEAGHDSAVSISVSGSGEDSAAWQSMPLGVKGGGLYEFSFWSRKEPGTTGGTAFAGLNGCSRDFQPSETWKRYAFAFRAPEQDGDARIRLGQWMMKGKVFFDGVEIYPADPIYQVRGVYELGEGEAVSGRSYQARHILRGEGSNASRFLVSSNASFNSDRWIFLPKAAVVYRHSYPGNLFVKGEVRIQLNHYESGTCRVSARNESGDWIEIGRLAKVSSGAFPLPHALINQNTVEVKLEGVPDLRGECNFQINQYEFTGDLFTAVDDFQGKTRYARILRSTPDVGVRLHTLGNPMPGKESTLTFSLKNGLDRRRKFRFQVQAEGPTGKTEKNRSLFLDPGEEQRILTPYLLKETGDHVVRLNIKERSGQSFYESEISIPVPNLYAVDYGDLIRKDDTAAVWWCSAMHKVPLERPAPKRGKRVVQISAARGEYESVQVIVRPEQALTNLAVQAEELRGRSGYRIGKENLSVRQVKYVYVHSPSDRLGTTDFYPDPLPPVEGPVALAAGQNQPFWITVHVPDDAPAGSYEGKMIFQEDGWKAAVTLRLQVFAFTLPKAFSLRTALGFDTSLVKKYHHLESDDDVRRVVDLYYQDFKEHRISPYDPTSLSRIHTALRNGSDGKLHYQFDFSDFDRAGERYFDDFGFTSLRLSLAGMGGGTFHDRYKGRIGDYEQGTPDHERLFGEYASTIEKHLEDKGWLKKAFVYWFDEPDPKDYDFVKEGMDLIHRHAPKLNRYLTEQPEPILFGNVDTWCTILNLYEPEISHERQRLGEEIWWYICTAPKAPYPGLFIDHNAVDLRAWIWMSFLYGLDGCLVWKSNYWTSSVAFPEPELQDPWSDPASYVTGYGREKGTRENWGNGDGRFIYPPENWKEDRPLFERPVDSMRWEILRDGIEDYEYFNMIEQAVENGDLSIAHQRRAETLLQIPGTIIHSLTDYSKDPDAYEMYRQQLADFIEDVIRPQ